MSEQAAGHPLFAASTNTELGTSAEDPAVKSSSPVSGSWLPHATIRAFLLKAWLNLDLVV